MRKHPNEITQVYSFAFLQLVVIQYISSVASYIEMPERHYPRYWRGFMACFGLVSYVFTIAVATNYRPNTFGFLAGLMCKVQRRIGALATWYPGSALGHDLGVGPYWRFGGNGQDMTILVKALAGIP